MKMLVMSRCLQPMSRNKKRKWFFNRITTQNTRVVWPRSISRKKNIKLVVWPSQSPDLNPIETIWAIMKYKLRFTEFACEVDLKTEILRLWNSVSLDLCRKLSMSMNKRISACIKARGGHFSYQIKISHFLFPLFFSFFRNKKKENIKLWLR